MLFVSYGHKQDADQGDIRDIRTTESLLTNMV